MASNKSEALRRPDSGILSAKGCDYSFILALVALFVDIICVIGAP